MRNEKIALCFDIDKQIEIERIANDDEQADALAFIKNLKKEFDKRRDSHCEVMLDWTSDKKDLSPK